MKTAIRIMLAAAALLASHGLIAQAPAGTPAGATGLCKDGTYWTGASKQGACRGHQGVKDWYAAASTTSPAPAPAAAKPAPAAAAPATPAPAPKAATKPAPATTASTAPAAGGGPGMVWVNTDSKVYHCYGAKYYGTTKQGKYMTEADAKSSGARPDHGNACSK